MDGKEFDLFADDLLEERGGRALFIVAAARVDELLADVLGEFFLPKLSKGKEKDELLAPDGPASTFSSRIKLCRRLNLIKDRDYRALEKLRAIRNSCAHDVVLDLNSSPTRDHFADLKGKVADWKAFHLMARKYFDGGFTRPFDEHRCLLLTMCAVLEAARKRAATRSVRCGWKTES